MSEQPKARAIAFYLPQYYPTPENDLWWGKGFTEWTNVTRARPLYRGHYQPRLPADLGLYDLRVPEVRSAQADLARSAGIEGFCYWHYWFGHGRRMLDRPLAEVLQSGQPDFPFCVCWANESWTGIWHGAPDRILMEQQYPGEADTEALFHHLVILFRDPRYMRVNGKPIFVVYSPQNLPDAADFVRQMHLLAERAGLPGLYLVSLTRDASHLAYGFDAFAHKPPSGFVGQLLQGNRVQKSIQYRLRGWLERKRKGLRVFDYDLFTEIELNQPLHPSEIPTVLSNWDNTPRSGRHGFVLEQATPEKFGAYLKASVQRIVDRPQEKRLIFLKAWNEWAEGNYLEPDQLYGTGYIEACRRVLLGHE